MTLFSPQANRLGRIGAVAFLLWLFKSNSPAATLVSEDFEGYTTGSLVGQGAWTAVSNLTANNPVVTVGTGLDTTHMLFGNAAASPSTSAANEAFSNFNLTTAQTLTIQMDVLNSQVNSIAVAGVGQSPTLSDTVGIFSGAFVVRETSGTLHSATNLTPITGHLYTIQSVWNLSGTGTATLLVKDLTAGDTSFTQLFFDASHTVTTATLNLPTSGAGSISTWDSLALRLGDSGAPFGGALDNIVVTATAVPEPSALSFLGLAGLGLWTLIRRRWQGKIA